MCLDMGHHGLIRFNFIYLCWRTSFFFCENKENIQIERIFCKQRLFVCYIYLSTKMSVFMNQFKKVNVCFGLSFLFFVLYK